MRAFPLLVLLLPASARANFESPLPGEVAFRDMPGTDNTWHEARSIVDAPPETVRRWLTEFEYWPGRFRDVQAARVLKREGATAEIWMLSTLMGRPMVLSVRMSDEGIFYHVDRVGVHARSRVYVSPAPNGRTDVIMQSSVNLTGLLGILAPKDVVRDRERRKLSADLTDLHRLARSRRLSRWPKPLDHTEARNGPEGD